MENGLGCHCINRPLKSINDLPRLNFCETNKQIPLYRYHCQHCSKEFDAYLPMPSGRWTIDRLRLEPKRSAPCPECEVPSTEVVISAGIQFSGTRVESPEFNPGLGCVVKNKRHKQDLLKRKNLVEVGNDFGSGEKQQKDFDKRKQEEREKRWRDPKEFFL